MTDISEAPVFPDEAFPCPYCGQMLAPSCRVCVACKSPIDPHHIVRPAPPAPQPIAAAEVEKIYVPLERVRFSWSIFIKVLLVWFGAMLVCGQLLSRPPNRSAGGAQNDQTLSFEARYQQALQQYGRADLAFEALLLLSSAWVLYDARKRGLPKPQRWAVGCAASAVVFPILWVFIFSWYLSRRRQPNAACPFIENEAGSVAIVLFFALFVLFLLGMILAVLNGPPAH